MEVEADSDLKLIKYPIIHHIFIANTVKININIFLTYFNTFNLTKGIYFLKIINKDIIVNIKNINIGTNEKENDVNSNKILKSIVQVKNNLVLSNDSIIFKNIKTSSGRNAYKYIDGLKSEKMKIK